ATMPCFPGTTPVTMLVCDGYVTLGNTESAPSLLAPRATSARSVGTRRPCASGWRYASGSRPSIVMRTTWWIGPGGWARALLGEFAGDGGVHAPGAALRKRATRNRLAVDRFMFRRGTLARRRHARCGRLESVIRDADGRDLAIDPRMRDRRVHPLEQTREV